MYQSSMHLGLKTDSYAGSAVPTCIHYGYMDPYTPTIFGTLVEAVREPLRGTRMGISENRGP